MSDGTTGVAAVDSMVAWSVAAAALVGLAGLLWRVLRAVLRIADRVDEAWEDWSGSEARPGVPARPGVMARLGDHEQRITRVETRLPGGNGT